MISFSPLEEGSYELRFEDGAARAEHLALLNLEYFSSLEEQEGTLLLLKLNKVSIHHIGFIKTRLLYYKYYKKPEQSLYQLKSYSAAYSYPRRVRLVSFRRVVGIIYFLWTLWGIFLHAGNMFLDCDIVMLP